MTRTIKWIDGMINTFKWKIAIAVIVLCCCSCSKSIVVTVSPHFAGLQYHYVEKRSKRIIKKMHARADTVFALNAEIANTLWYFKDNAMYSFSIYGHYRFALRRYKPSIKQNVSISAIKSEELDYYFDNSFDKDIPCFWNQLDGIDIEIHIKNQPVRTSGIETYCLFGEQYDKDSFPYKLQYMLSLLFTNRKEDFEKLYSYP